MSLSSESGAMASQARTALEEEHLEDAIQAAQKMVWEDSANFDAWWMLGLAHTRARHRPAAVEAFIRCVRLRPNNSEMHFQLAQAMLFAGDRKGAQAELETCLEIDPRHLQAQQAILKWGTQTANPGAGVPLASALMAREAGEEIGQSPPLIGARPARSLLDPERAELEEAPPPAVRSSVREVPGQESAPLPGSFRWWTISAMLVGCFYWLLDLAWLMTSRAQVESISDRLFIVATFGFVGLGYGALKRIENARTGLFCCGGAAALVSLAGLMTWVMAVTRPISQEVVNCGPTSASQGLVILCQLIYCSLLCLQMLSPAAEQAAGSPRSRPGAYISRPPRLDYAITALLLAVPGAPLALFGFKEVIQRVDFSGSYVGCVIGVIGLLYLWGMAVFLNEGHYGSLS